MSSSVVSSDRSKRLFRFVPVVARSSTIYHGIGPVAYDCIKLIVVRAGSATLLSELGQHKITTGDVVLVAASTLCGSEPYGSVTVTTLYLDRDYVIDQVFWQHAAVLSDRFEAEEIIATVYADPMQILRLGPDRVGYLSPWLDELVALSLDGPGPGRFYRVQALLFAVLDVVVPYIRVTTSRQSAAQRMTACPTLPRPRQFRPLRGEAHQAAELLRRTPEHRWTLTELANSVHLSPSQLGRVFVHAYGKSPIAYLTMIRVERLADLLRNTDQPVGLAARHVGWADPDYATRQFRRCVGLTPTDYRRRQPDATL